MKKVTKRVAQSLSALKTSAEFKVFIEWLEESRDDAVVTMSKSDREIMVGRGQGSYNEINDILETIEDANILANKFA